VNGATPVRKQIIPLIVSSGEKLKGYVRTSVCRQVARQARLREESLDMTRKRVARSSRPSQAVEKRGDWRDELVSRIRALIMEADPEMVEERKWRKPSNRMAGVPVWSHNGIVCTGETYKNAVKMTFAKGASLKDPAGLFNSGPGGGTRRAIDFHEGDRINERALKALVKAAVKLNMAGRER
jgi:hypothetical protein